MTVRVGVDWGAYGVISWGANPTDALNQYINAHTYSVATFIPEDSDVVVTNVFDKSPTAGINSPVKKVEFTQSSGEKNLILYYNVGVDYTTHKYLFVWVSGACSAVNMVNYNYVTPGTTVLDTATLSGSDYQKLELMSTTAPPTDHVRAIEIVGDVGDVVYIHAVACVSDVISVYNNGNVYSLYTDITSHVYEFTTQLGKNTWDGTFPDEGTASITIINREGLFSPENDSSPLFGYLLKGKRVVIQCTNSSGVWETIWSGYTDEYVLSANPVGDHVGIVKCIQGVERLLNKTYTQPFVHDPDYTTYDLLKLLFANSDYVPAAEYRVAAYDQTSYDNSYFMSDEIIEDMIILEGSPVNVSWILPEDDVSIQIRIRELSELEGGSLYLTRQGKLRFVTRDTQKTATPPSVSDVGLFTDLTYIVFQEPITAIDISRTRMINLNQFVSRQQYFDVIANGVFDDDLTLYAIKPDVVAVIPSVGLPYNGIITTVPMISTDEFYYEDGDLVITNPYLYDGTTFEAVPDPSLYDITLLPQGAFHDMFTAAQTRLDLHVASGRVGHSFYFRCTIEGNFWSSYGDVTERYYNPNQTGNLTGTVEDKTNSLITTDATLLAYLDAYWAKRAVTSGWFGEAVQMGQPTTIDHMLAYSVGDLITFDYTTLVTPTVYKVQIVEGESWNYSRGVLTKTSKYSLRG